MISSARRRRLSGVLPIMLVSASLLIPAAPATAAPTQISYLIMPHPDDEFQPWALVSGSFPTTRSSSI